MSIWAGIKYALNSTLGTESFKPLDRLIHDTVVENHDKLITQEVITEQTISNTTLKTATVTLTHPAIVFVSCEVRPYDTSSAYGTYLGITTQQGVFSTSTVQGSYSHIRTLDGQAYVFAAGNWSTSSSIPTSNRATVTSAWILPPGTYKLNSQGAQSSSRATVKWSYYYLTGGVGGATE